MSDIKWIKVAVDMFEDHKIEFIRSLPEGDAIIVTWIQMLSIAGQSNTGGYLMVTDEIPYTEQLLSNKLRRQPVFLQFAIETLIKLKMLNLDDGPYHITKWEKHQNVDGMEKVRLDTAKRVARHRAKEKGQLKLNEGNVTVTLHVTQDVTQCNEIELDLDLEKDKNNIYPEIQDDTKIIFDHWNAKKIMRHREMTAAMKSHVNARLEKYTADEIVTAIDNYYAIITDSETYWYSHKFTLQEFVNPKNLVRFLTENNPFEVHRKNVVTFDKEKRGNDYSDHKMRLQEQMEGRNEYGDTRIS